MTKQTTYVKQMKHYEQYIMNRVSLISMDMKEKSRLTLNSSQNKLI